MKPCIYNVFTAPTFENLVKLSISSYLNVKGCTISEGYTSVMDLYSRKIISWVLNETLEASHVVKCSVFTTVCFVCNSILGVTTQGKL
mgnify:CR=1 FL=1